MESLIIGVFGEISSGKSLVAKLLKEKYNFLIVDLSGPKTTETNLTEMMDKISLYDIIKTKNKENNKIVIDSVQKYKDYEPFYNKNNFKLIYITASSESRLNNYILKNNLTDDIETYKKFLQADSKLIEPWFYKIKDRADYTIINNGNINELEKGLQYIIDLIYKSPRPTWDRYFMNICHNVSRRSNCIKRRVGALIVKNNRILAAGYNGTPSRVKNCFEGGCERCCSGAKRGVDLDKCWCLHAEENAIVEIGRKECAGATLFTTVFPCILCSKLLLSCGIERIVYDSHYLDDSTLFETDFTKRDLCIEKLDKVVSVISTKNIDEIVKFN
jgi:dCMP deaminase